MVIIAVAVENIVNILFYCSSEVENFIFPFNCFVSGGIILFIIFLARVSLFLLLKPKGIIIGKEKRGLSAHLKEH